MTQEDAWAAPPIVDAYLADRLALSDPALDAATAASAAAGLPEIAVSPAYGRLLHILARSVRARRILEIGTLGGYSAIWLARALPAGAEAEPAGERGGRLITLEADPRHAEVARANIARAGLADRVDIHLGPGLETLPNLAAEQPSPGPFDLIFIDADKENIPAYFDWAVRLARPGSLVIVDNVVREGEIANAASDDPSVRGVRRFLDGLAADKRVTATVIQTVGVKKYDGFALAIVL